MINFVENRIELSEAIYTLQETRVCFNSSFWFAELQSKGESEVNVSYFIASHVAPKHTCDVM